MDYPIDLPFNPAPLQMMHIDLNSCFASVEQQADTRLRGKPIVVAAYRSPRAFILAPSVEAKKIGIKMGMRVKDAQEVCPDVVVLEPDPWKYRNVHLALNRLLCTYTDNVEPKSIDEFVLDFAGAPSYQNLPKEIVKQKLFDIGAEIKKRIKSEVGDWLTVSIGISTNRYLAKIASNLKKPDGLDVIDQYNYLKVFESLELHKLTGIKDNNVARLNMHQIFSVLEFYNATPMTLQQTFHAVTGHYWYMRLHGWEVDNNPTHRRSYGNSVALGPKLSTPKELAPTLTKLVEKMAARMRAKGYSARGIHLSLLYKTGNYWHKGVTLGHYLFSSIDIYKVAYKLLQQSPYKSPVHIIAVSCFDLMIEKNIQLHLMDKIDKKKLLTQALDVINNKWGDFVVTPATMIHTHDLVKDRISFGGVRELEEVVFPSGFGF